MYNGHPWYLIKWPFDRGALLKVVFRLAVAELYWLLLTGGRCLKVVVMAGLTVAFILYCTLSIKNLNMR